MNGLESFVEKRLVVRMTDQSSNQSQWDTNINVYHIHKVD